MFSVCFVRNDNKPDEIYYYHQGADARHHLDLFRNDDSGLYKRIILTEVTDENSYEKLVDIIGFE